MRGLRALVVSGLLLSGAIGCFGSHERRGGTRSEAPPSDPPARDIVEPSTDSEPNMPPDREPPDREPPDDEPGAPPDDEPMTPSEPPFTLTSQPIAIEAEPGYMFTPHHQILGDLDGDGIDDFVLFAIDPSNIDIFAANVASAAYVFYGRADLPPRISATDADAVLRGEGFGIALIGAPTGALGDVNGDALADLVIAGTRSLYFVFGSRQRLTGEHVIGDVALSWTFPDVGQPTPAPLTQPLLLAPAGDIEGDGISDFALTLQTGTHEERFPSGVSYSPIMSTFVFSGQSGEWSSGAFDPAWARAELATSEGRSGVTLSTAADVDGDGYSDLLLLVDGRLRLLRGGEDAPEGAVLASEAGMEFPVGVRVDRLPDIDGDGSDELAWKDFGGLPNTYVTYGGGSLLAELALEPDLDVGGDNLTVGTMTAADLDGDGAEDLIVATNVVGSFPDPAPAPAGGIFVVPGGGAPFSGQLVLSERYLLLAGNDGEGDGPVLGRFGRSLDAGGDVTGDGITDLLAVTVLMDDSRFGRSRVVLIPGGLERSDAR